MRERLLDSAIGAPLFRLSELRRSWSPALLQSRLRYLRRGAPDGLPLPPARFVTRVGGTASLDWYFGSSRQQGTQMRAELDAAGVELAKLGSLLDLGCGCGRLLRGWQDRAAVAIHGCDRDAAMIRWCQRALPFAHFATNAEAPPTPYPDQRFDLVYAVSLFTHLRPEAQAGWLAEARRILKPGGVLLMTTHGEAYRGQLDAAEQARFAASELVVRHPNASGSNLCAVFHPPGLVEKWLSTGFERLRVTPGDFAAPFPQDLYIARKC